MKLFIFTTTDPECPPNAKAIGRIQCAMVGRGGGSVIGWHPVLFIGSTEAEVAAKSRVFWEEEHAKFAALSDPKRKARRMEAATGYALEIDFDPPAPAALAEAEEAI